MSTVVLSELFGDPRLPSRFWAKVSVNPANDCWDWTASRDRKGYGSFGVASGRMFGAHRVAFRALDSRSVEGLDLDHLCRNRACVNPAHLEPVTHQENIRRGRSGEPQRSRTHCPANHPYDAENTYIATRANGATNRQCRRCKANFYQASKRKQAMS